MRFADDEKTELIVNDHLRLRNIPAATHRYHVNGRTPLEWFTDRYRIRQDKESGIVNDPNGWFDDRTRSDRGDPQGRPCQRRIGTHHREACPTLPAIEPGAPTNPSSMLTFHPKPGTLLICDFDTGFKAPEMIKKRPVVVISPRRRGSVAQLCTVVPLSTTAPDPVERFHHRMNPKSLPVLLRSQDTWAKCDMPVHGLSEQARPGESHDR